VVPKTDSHCTSPTLPIRARISGVVSSVIFWQPMTATTSWRPDAIAIQAVRIAAEPEAQATSVSHVGFGFRFRYSCTTPAMERCLWYSGTAAMTEASTCPGSRSASARASRHASKASSCTLASLRRPKIPWPMPTTPTLAISPPWS
jgi:hypothetical protein